MRKETSTYKGFNSTFAALFSYQGVVVRVRVPLFATQKERRGRRREERRGEGRKRREQSAPGARRRRRGAGGGARAGAWSGVADSPVRVGTKAAARRQRAAELERVRASEGGEGPTPV